VLRTLVTSILAALLLATLPAEPGRALGESRAELVVSGLNYPIFVAAPLGDARLFVVEKLGRVRVVQAGVLLPTPFLDILSQVSSAGEGGLLGLAFPADYATSGLFYVYYTNLAGDSVVSRFSVSGDPNVADLASQQIVLTIDQPSGRTNHKGGTIAFGPDGFLWFATGDGGGGSDPDELAQDPQSLLGKMLRIDVGPVFDPTSIVVPGQFYRIPADNPFVASPPRDEIWAFGLRNPYRWSFDRETGDAWIADVGQGMREELDFEPAGDPGGRNYGWDVMEGSLCNGFDPAPSPPAPECNDPSLTLPLYEYDHSGNRCSIIGGYVSRAAPDSSLTGLYFFADFCSHQIWSLDPDTLEVVDRSVELLPAAGGTGFITGFGEDGFGTIHLTHGPTGQLYRIVPRQCGNGIDDDGDGLTDFPADPGCRNAAGNVENPQCDDGLDNDGDATFDWDGAGVGPPDVFCNGQGWRTREKPKSCGLGFELGLLLPALFALRLGRRRRP
jgi:glucose/arabinose dehydrogenase